MRLRNLGNAASFTKKKVGGGHTAATHPSRRTHTHTELGVKYLMERKEGETNHKWSNVKSENSVNCESGTNNNQQTISFTWRCGVMGFQQGNLLEQNKLRAAT